MNRTSRETEAQMTTHTPQSHTSSTQTHTSQETKTTLLTPLKNSIYRRLFTAHVLALTATGLLNVGLGLLAFDIAGDRAGAVVSMALTIKILIYVCAGPWLSAFFARFPVKAVLVGSDIIRIAVGCSLPFITSEAQVYVAVAVLQMAAATFTPTFQALIPRIINNQNEYTSALSLSRIAYDLEQILSPVLAAMLLSFASRGQVFAVAAVGFVGSATMIAGSGSLGVDKRESVSRRVREGMVTMLRLPELRGVLALNLALAAPTALVLVNTVVLVRGQLGRSESDVAVLLGACGAGSIVMALLIPHLRLHVTLFGGAGGAVAGLLGFFLLIDAAPTWPVFISLWFVLGMSMSALATPIGQVIRRNVADEELGSVFAAQFSLSHACYMLTYPLAGWCGAALGLGWTSLLLALIAGFALIAAANVWPSVHVDKDV